MTLMFVFQENKIMYGPLASESECEKVKKDAPKYSISCATASGGIVSRGLSRGGMMSRESRT